MATPEIPNMIDCGQCSLLLINQTNVWFIEELFRYEDIKKYYVLRADHAANIKSFCQYLVNANTQKASLNFLIYNNYGEEVGLITAESIMSNGNNMQFFAPSFGISTTDPIMNSGINGPMWNVGYAVHPTHRQKGYASSAVKGLSDFLLQNFAIQYVMLDICSDNVGSEMVAKKCGFVKPNNRMGYIDPEHIELGLRFRWFKQLAGGRTSYFNQAVVYHRRKLYGEAVDAYKKALDEPYTPGTPFTDAQIYSNMGMSLSSMRRYQEAFRCLMKAQSLGLNNPSIEKELLWLRNNVGLY